MVRSLRSIWHRAGLSEQEVRTLRGVVTALTQRPHAARKEQAALMKALEAARKIPSPSMAGPDPATNGEG
jgi:tRNA C32,U32 (ribose-2'-O)-methylase TrmJ